MPRLLANDNTNDEQSSGVVDILNTTGSITSDLINTGARTGTGFADGAMNLANSVTNTEVDEDGMLNASSGSSSILDNIANSIQSSDEITESTGPSDYDVQDIDVSSYSIERMSGYILPGTGTQVDSDTPEQSTPLLQYYSPRLFGAPPQLTNQCDMRILSSDGENPGAVGDFYLTRILQDSSVANFVVGRARFIGGLSSAANIIKECFYYGKALSKYNIFDTNGTGITSRGAGEALLQQANEETYKKAYGERDEEDDTTSLVGAISDFLGDTASDIDKDVNILNIANIKNVNLLNQVGSILGGAGVIGALKTSLSVQQPFYTFEDDWNTYINNVKMMINTAVIMLGLQRSCVRIGNVYYPIGMDVNVKDANDVWANYRFMTPIDGLGDVTAVNKDNGDTTQYVSFMIDPTGVSESISNSIGQSQIYSSVLNAGTSVGSELSFITNATAGSASDKVINLAQESKETAEEVLKNMSSGSGRFTAAIASSMARSFVGDHTIYPEVFQGHSAASSMSITVHLTSDAGDPYSYLVNILVPLFFMMGMALPALSSNNASAYTYPPVIQCNIPGMWGTRLGMVESLTISKNPNSKDVSINGYPLQVDVTMNIKDLQHVLLTSPMNKPSTFLNNHTMFDYIAQISGVDKYRVNGSMRTVARLALAASALNNTFNNIADAVMTDWHSLVNKTFAYDRQ